MTDKSLPFSLDRNDSRPLVGQVTDGIRKAIVDGYYVPGDVLPSVRDMGPMLGVSVIVTSAAVKQLAKEGFVTPRPRIGTVVRDRSVRQWRGHVVLVEPEEVPMYSRAIIACLVRKVLLEAGYLMSVANVGQGDDGRCDFGRLDAFLSRSTDLVIAHHVPSATLAHLAERGVPYAVVTDVARPPRGAVGLTRLDYDAAKDRFMARCIELGVKKVLVVYWGGSSVSPDFACGSLRIEKIAVEVDVSRGRLEGIRRAGFDTFSRIVADGGIDRDAVYFIADDYLASGALMALSYAGLRSPEDVRLATWSNAGISNVYPRELSRMEMDSAEAGRRIAASTLEYLRTGVYPSGAVGPRWIDGDTMGGAKPKRRRKPILRGTCLAAIAFLAAFSAAAEDIAKSDSNVAVKTSGGVTLCNYTLDKPRKMAVYVARIDLTMPCITFTGTERDPRWGEPIPGANGSDKRKTIGTKRETTVEFVRRRRSEGKKVEIAVNTTGFGPWERPYDHEYAGFYNWLCVDGVEISHLERRADRPYFIIYRDGTIEIRRGVDFSKRDGIAIAMYGNALLLKNGRVGYAKIPRGTTGDLIAPRTVLGLTADKRTLVILAVDGRQRGYSEGARYPDLVEILKREGVADAINMDGGGSTSLVVFDRESDMPRMLNHQPNGVQRKVGMNLGIAF